MMLGGVDYDLSGNGGLMTISPPANVKQGAGGGLNLPDQVEAMTPLRLPCEPPGDGQAARCLSYGVDTFVASVDVDWSKGEYAASKGGRPPLFDLLDDAKAKAVERSGQSVPVRIDGPGAWGDLIANVRAFGTGGYSWLVESRYMTLKIGGWMTPGSRPSIVVELRSEGCWRYTAKVLLLYLRRLVEHHGGRVAAMKASRVDVCVDVLVRDGEFHAGIEESMVTRAVDTAQWRTARKITGVGVGGSSAPLKARLYDKVVEIEKKGAKFWFYDVWGIEAVPKGHRIIRVEYQIRREKLKQMGVGDAEDLFSQLGNVWSYLTKKWLRLVDDPKKHHTMQTVLPWWSAVQSGWFGQGEAKPVVLAEPVRAERTALVRQIVGCWSSLIAIDETRDIAELSTVDLGNEVRGLIDAAEALEKDPESIGDSVRDKLAKYRAIGEKFTDAVKYRRILQGEALRLVSFGAATDRKARIADGSVTLGNQFYRRLYQDSDTVQTMLEKVEYPEVEPPKPPARKPRARLSGALFAETRLEEAWPRF